MIDAEDTTLDNPGMITVQKGKNSNIADILWS